MPAYGVQGISWRSHERRKPRDASIAHAQNPANTGTTTGTGTLAGSCSVSEPSPEAVFRWAPAVSGRAIIETCGSDYDTVLYVRRGACTPGGEGEICADDDCGTQERTPVDVAVGDVYFIFVDGYNGAQGGFRLTVTPPGASTTTSTTAPQTTSTSRPPTTTSTTATSSTSTTSTTIPCIPACSLLPISDFDRLMRQGRCPP